MNALDLSIGQGKTLGDLVFSPLDEAGIEPLVVDAGARGGTFELPTQYALRSSLLGFEPNPAAHATLSTPTDRSNRGTRPKFKSERYLDVALWDSSGHHDLYLTRGRGATTMLGLPDEQVTQRMFRNGEDESFFDAALKVEGTTQVRTCRLDSLIEDSEKIDFFKIDVEGAELRVLSGATRLLQRGGILFIQAEFVMMGYLPEHSLFGEQHKMLNDSGFRLIDLNVDQTRYSRDPTPLPAHIDRRPAYGGDALYVLDPDRAALDKLDRQRLAALTIALGFRSFGLSLLKDAGLLSKETLEIIEARLHAVPVRQRLLHIWHSAPRMARNLIGRIIRH